MAMFLIFLLSIIEIKLPPKANEYDDLFQTETQKGYSIVRLLARLIPFGVSLVVTPFLLFAGLVSAGMGHGNFVVAKLLFPYIFCIRISFQFLPISP